MSRMHIMHVQALSSEESGAGFPYDGPNSGDFVAGPNHHDFCGDQFETERELASRDESTRNMLKGQGRIATTTGDGFPRFFG